MTRQQRKDARPQTANAPAHSYSAVRAVASRQVGMDYQAVSVTPATGPQDARAEKSWEMTQPSVLARIVPDTGVYPFPGQTRANGRAL